MNVDLNLKNITTERKFAFAVTIYGLSEWLVLSLFFTESPIDLSERPIAAFLIQAFRVSSLVLVEMLLYSNFMQVLRKSLEDGEIDAREAINLFFSGAFALTYTAGIALLYFMYDGYLSWTFQGFLNKPLEADTMVNQLVIMGAPIIYLLRSTIVGEKAEKEEEETDKEKKETPPKDFKKGLVTAFGTVTALLKSGKTIADVEKHIDRLSDERAEKAYEYVHKTSKATEMYDRTAELGAFWMFIEESMVPSFDRAEVKKVFK